MTKTELATRLDDLLKQTLDTGPGPRAVALIVADRLADFILNEAGAMAPGAIEEVADRRRYHLAAAVAAEV